MSGTQGRRAHLLTLIRFGLVGGFNSLLHASIVLALNQIVSWPGFVLIMIAWIVCIPIGYVTQAKLVWHAELHWRGLTKISISQLPSAAISTALGALGGALGFPVVVQELMTLVSGALISYFLQRYWVFAADVAPLAGDAPVLQVEPEQARPGPSDSNREGS